jgi:hypothetical protein
VEGRRKPGKLVSLGPDSNSEHFEWKSETMVNINDSGVK